MLETSGHRFGYTVPEQRRWARHHQECAGKYQSPIAIYSSKVCEQSKRVCVVCVNFRFAFFFTYVSPHVVVQIWTGGFAFASRIYTIYRIFTTKSIYAKFKLSVQQIQMLKGILYSSHTWFMWRVFWINVNFKFITTMSKMHTFEWNA